MSHWLIPYRLMVVYCRGASLRMRESGARVLAIESEMTIILDEAEVVRLANKLGIAIVSLKAEELRLRVAG